MSLRSNIRRAASIVLQAKDDDPRVYLVRRNPQLRYFGGFWAFPGGAVDASDESNSDRVVGATDDEAPFVLSAAREMLEELGLWTPQADAASAPPPDQLERLRRELLEDDGRFVAKLRELDTRVPASRFHNIARLLTPAFSPIRFDTIFYKVAFTDCAGGEPTIWQGELVDGQWDAPSVWLKRWEAGEILIAPPVILMLQILDEHGWKGGEAHLEELTAGFVAGRIHPIFFNPAVQLLPLLTPTMPPATHTNAYLVGRDPAYLVDPATPHQEVQDRLVEALDEAVERGLSLKAILLTHHHPDHVGAVELIRRRFELPVWAHPVTADLLAGEIEVDRSIQDEERLPLGTAPSGWEGWELVALFTPGHAAGHLAYFEDEYGSLIAGDMVSTLSSILVHPDDGDMSLYERSLKRLTELDCRMVYPAHGPGSALGSRLLQQQLEHRQKREEAILMAIRDGASSVAAVVERVYVDVPEPMHAMAALSVESVVQKLMNQSQVERADGRLSAD